MEEEIKVVKEDFTEYFKERFVEDFSKIKFKQDGIGYVLDAKYDWTIRFIDGKLRIIPLKGV